MDISDQLEIIGDWAKSCKTQTQLDIVKSFLDKKVNSPYTTFPKNQIANANYHLGMVNGIILSISKLRFND